MAINLRNFAARAITAVIGAIVIAGVALFLPKPYLVVVFLGLAILGVYEMRDLAKGFGLEFFVGPTIICLLFGFLSFYLPVNLNHLPYLAMLIYTIWGLYKVKDLKQSLPSLGVNLAGLLYLGTAFFSLAGIFLLENADGAMVGRELLLFFFGIVWLGDSAAYLLGSSFGKHKIAPKISPKKSWEGFLGNYLGNLVATLIGKTYFFGFMTYQDVFFISAAVFLIGFFGDLVESSWKRGGGIKDSGTIIPGHGGILDRVDSIFLTGPVFFAYFYFMFQMNG